MIIPNIEAVLKLSEPTMSLDDLKAHGLIFSDEFLTPESHSFPDKIISTNIDPAFLHSMLQNDTILFQSLILEFNKQYDEAQVKMKDFEIQKPYKLSENERNKYITRLTLICRSTCYYPNTDVKKFFKKAGFDEELLSWFISLESILKHIDKILQREKIVFLRGAALMNLDAFLKMRITNAIMIWAGQFKFSYGKIINPNSRFLEAKKTIRREGQLIFDDKALKEGMNALETLFGTEQNTQNLLSFFRGDTTKTSLLFIIELSLQMTNMKAISLNKFYAEFYDLYFPFLKKRHADDVLGYKLKSDKELRNENQRTVIQQELYKGKRIKEIFTR